MKKSLCVTFTIMAVCLSCAPDTAVAQAPATSLRELQGRIAAGQTVTVMDISGTKTRGLLTGLSESELRLTADGREQTFTVEDLAEVRVQHKDSLWNGILIGAAAGSAYLIFLVATDWCSDEGPNCGGGYAWSAAFIAIGAGAGAAIDVARKGQITVYRRSTLAIGVAPTLQRHSQGLLISVRF